MEPEKSVTLGIVKHIQAVVEQMKIDDIENSPGAAEEEFQCPCCGELKTLAGTVIYGSDLYCNDCVLLTEISLALNKINDPHEMIAIMSDKRFDNIYQSLFMEQDNSQN